jgi:hypothetical protein
MGGAKVRPHFDTGSDFFWLRDKAGKAVKREEIAE